MKAGFTASGNNGGIPERGVSAFNLTPVRGSVDFLPEFIMRKRNLKIAHLKYRAVIFAAIFALGVFSGCRRPSPVNIRVTGTGIAEIAPRAPVKPEQIEENPSSEMSSFDRKVSAVGYGKPPENAIGKNQARMMAKQAAKLDAMRKLMQKAQKINITPQFPLGHYMAQNEKIKRRVENLVRKSRIASREELDDGSFSVKMQMSILPLKEMIEPEKKEEPPEPEKPETGPLSPEQARKIAESEAKRDAYRQLLEYVKGVNIDPATTVEDMMFRNDKIQFRVKDFIKTARITDKRYTEDGTAEVDMVLEHPDIAKILR